VSALSFGLVRCPRCQREDGFRLENRHVCVTVMCACGWEAGELQRSGVRWRWC